VATLCSDRLARGSYFPRHDRCAQRIATALVPVHVNGSQPKTLIVCSPTCSYPYGRWVDQAKVPTPDTALTVQENIEGCGHPTLGCTNERDTIWLWIDPVVPPRVVRVTLLHELGHIYLQGESEDDAERYADCALVSHPERHFIDCAPWR
jgi:hypothetical protein